MEMLFNVEPDLPPGFSYSPEFISKDEEQQLIKAISRQELRTFIFQGFTARRRTASFGFDYSFESRELKKGKPIPAEFNWLIDRVSDRLSLRSSAIAELLLIEYPPGSVINWHRDAPPFDLIAGISLLTDVAFKLRPHAKEKQGRASIVSMHVAPRSLYVIQGEARSDWQHATAPVKSTRYSITLRTLRSA